MPRVHRLYAGGAESLNAQCPVALKINPVVSKGEIPKGVPLALPQRLYARNAGSRGSSMRAVCSELEVFGLKQNPVKCGAVSHVDDAVTWVPKRK
jgi:hypothetical protein